MGALTIYLHAVAHAAGACAQVLGRNLEGLVTKAMELKVKWKDEFVSVEHLVLAFLDDMRFGQNLLKDERLDAAKLEKAIKDIRGSNRVTDQVSLAALEGLNTEELHLLCPPAAEDQQGRCRRKSKLAHCQLELLPVHQLLA